MPVPSVVVAPLTGLIPPQRDDIIGVRVDRYLHGVDATAGVHDPNNSDGLGVGCKAIVRHVDVCHFAVILRAIHSTTGTATAFPNCR